MVETFMARAWMVVWLVFLIGCGRSSAPLTVHDKPVAHWLQALHDPDARARRKAIEALSNVGSADPAVIPALIEALNDREAGVRGTAVLALLKIGPEASDAVPALRKAQKDKDAKVRNYAAKALERIENPSEVN
jgi:HEAT repeat protein